MAASTPKKKKTPAPSPQGTPDLPPDLNRTPSLNMTPSLDMTPSMSFDPNRTPSLDMSRGDSSLGPNGLQKTSTTPYRGPIVHYEPPPLPRWLGDRGIAFYRSLKTPEKVKEPPTPESAIKVREDLNKGRHWVHRYYGDRLIQKTMAKIDKSILNRDYATASTYVKILKKHAKTLEPEIAAKLREEFDVRGDLMTMPPGITKKVFADVRRHEETMTRAYHENNKRLFGRSRDKLRNLAQLYDDETGDFHHFVRKRVERPEYVQFAEQGGIDSPDQLFTQYTRDNPPPRHASTPLSKYATAIRGIEPIPHATVFDPSSTPIESPIASQTREVPRQKAKKLQFDQAIVDEVMEDIRKMSLRDEPRAASSTDE